MLDKFDDSFKEGDVWRIQDKEDPNGYVWRAKNQKGILPENNFGSNQENKAREWSMNEKGASDEG